MLEQFNQKKRIYHHVKQYSVWQKASYKYGERQINEKQGIKRNITEVFALE